MNFRPKHIGLIAGILLVFLSFIFFARKHTTFTIILALGLSLSVAFFFAIILGKDTRKSKLRWTALFLTAIAIKQLLEPFLIDISYKIFLARHRDSLATVNTILKRHPGTFIVGDSVRCVAGSLSQKEQDTLLAEKEKLGVWTIEGNEKGIYYVLGRFTGARFGMTYWTSDKKPGKGYRSVEGAWVR